ncbi:MAG: thioredoxin family protein [Candidatus Pseudobacter hemicellulosilyticus]|uniref:Thioredoxin family protein n=1 Tax=Candidatus Pseudobacter hemicellulosilyticus TaxID=3121375 RepID=A0AAJ5WX42_9BACT|nr:MAG: thioredoxin family protein [Pseudobacter sp.]
MKQFLFSILLAGCTLAASAQDMASFKLYNPTANAEVELEKAIKEAKAAKKHVFVQIGGNWCVWCARFNVFSTEDKQIDSLIKANYIVYHLNYSKENYNKDLLKRFDYPQRFGFPVFVVLDANGKRLHTQDSGLLEEGKGYDKRRVMTFFQNWAPAALDPEQYKKF